MTHVTVSDENKGFSDVGRHLDDELDDLGLIVGDGADVLSGVTLRHLLDGQNVADGVVFVIDRFDVLATTMLFKIFSQPGNPH